MKEYVDGVVNIAKQEITSSKNAAVESVENAGSAAVGEVDTAKNAAMETISNAAEEINNIKTQADTTAALALQQANAAMNEVAAVENTVNDVKSGFESMEAILGTKVDGGYVENDSLYLTSNGEVVAGPFTGFGGSGTGGGGGSTNNAVLNVTSATGWVQCRLRRNPSHSLYLSVYIEFVFSKMQTTPRIGFWLDNSNQTPQQTVETILNVRKPV